MNEIQNIRIANQNNKLACEFFLHVGPPMDAFYNELLRRPYACVNGDQQLTLELTDYTRVMLLELSSTITLPCSAMRAVDFKKEYMQNHNCKDTAAVGLYFFRVVKREKIITE